MHPDAPTDEQPDAARLFEEFVTPPPPSKPRAWWHWMDGNVNEAGIDADLEWLAASGAGGVQMFFGSFGTPPRVSDPVVFRSPEWESAIARAVNGAAEHGLELSVATSAGWSATGGPWVRPAAGMKKLVWSTSTVSAGQPSPMMLQHPPSVSGPYQDIPFAAVRTASVNVPDFYEDVAVLAFPLKPGHLPLVPSMVSTSVSATGDRTADTLADGSFWPPLVFPGDVQVCATAEFPDPVTVRFTRIGLPSRLGFGGGPSPLARLEASDDNVLFTPVIELPPSECPVRSASFTPVTGRYFRLVVTPQSSGGIPTAPGIKPLTFPEDGPFLNLSAFQLFSSAGVTRAEEKAGFAPVPDYYALDSDDSCVDHAVLSEDVLDLTSRMDADGQFNWTPDQGEWTVLRIGYSLTGHVNGPAPAEATGLEVDKLDAGLVEAYLSTYLGFLDSAVCKEYESSEGILGLLSDSIESGPQNWTGAMIEEFQRRRGYSLIPWLPVLTGILVEHGAASDAFLWDFRKTISELLAENHYGTISRIAADRGMRYYAEALEDHRPQLGDDIEMRSHADVPMGAMWCYAPESGPRATFVADLRGAASVSHVYGKDFTGAESMTAFGQPFRFTPKILKPILDMEFALGVNLINIHTSPHQPIGVPAPGITLAPYLGQSFSRNETWAHAARPWLDYMARCSHLLQQGTYVADVAYFYGEESPVTGVFGDIAPEIPEGYGFDFINLDGLINHVTVTPEGELLTSGGTRYRLLYLGGTSRKMTLKALRRLRELLSAGATVAGWRPEGTPSNADDRAAWAETVESLWGKGHPGLLDLQDVDRENGADAALARMGLAPDWKFQASEGFSLPTLHRTTEHGELYFISNQLDRTEKVSATFRMTADAAEVWDPYLISRENFPVRQIQGGTVVDVELPPFGSAFILLRRSAPADHSLDMVPRNFSGQQEKRLVGTWHLAFAGEDRVPAGVTLDDVAPWSGPEAFTHSTADVKYFSGTATYSHSFTVDWSLSGQQFLIDLGDVHDIAEVRLNGEMLGTAWTYPFQVDATGAIRPGRNQLEVSVTNAWANRLSGDAALGDTHRPGSEIFLPDAPTYPAGLRGPVRLVAQQNP